MKLLGKDEKFLGKMNVMCENVMWGVADVSNAENITSTCDSSTNGRIRGFRSSRTNGKFMFDNLTNCRSQSDNNMKVTLLCFAYGSKPVSKQTASMKLKDTLVSDTVPCQLLL